MGGLAYYSSASGNTRRFIERLGFPAERVPVGPKHGSLFMDRPFVLIVPTYSDGSGRGAVAKGVIRFLNEERNRRLLRGVIGSGNTNFGDLFCQAAKTVAAKCGVPLLYRFELLGTPEDVENVRAGLTRFWRETAT